MTAWLCVYGQPGRGSFSEVGRGIAEAARAMGALSGLVYCSEEPPELPLEPTDAGAAPVAIITGPPVHLLFALASGRHQQRWWMLAPNSEGFPEGFVRSMLRPTERGEPLFHGLLAPSRWASQVLERHFEAPVLVMPHGVRDRRYIPEVVDTARQAYREGKFYVVHVTSSDRQRKATRQLMQAWKLLQDSERWAGAELFILCHPLGITMYERMAEEEGLSTQSCHLWQGLSLSSDDLSRAYCSAHVVCQPSRAEGFGLVPLEARICGSVVVATACTGHSEHMPARSERGVVVVPHEGSAPVDDYPGARAPWVAPHAIAEALRQAREQWPELQEQAVADAPALGQRWSWDEVLREPLEALRKRAV